MITSTSLQSSSFLDKVVTACDQAMNDAYLQSADLGSHVVLNSKGKPALLAIFRTGYGMEFIDAQDNDVTEVVMSALRETQGYKVFH